jgi:hypothetical protein
MRSLATHYPNLWLWQLGEVSETLLHLAAKENVSYYVIRIVAGISNARLIANRFGELPIQYVCKNENVMPEALSELIDEDGIALRQCDIHGRLVLHLLFFNFAKGQGSKKSIQVMNLLIKLYPKGQHAPDREGRTPIMLSLEQFSYRSNPDPPGILLQLNQVAAETPATLYTTEHFYDAQCVHYTALHGVIKCRFPRLDVVKLIITYNKLQPTRVDQNGELPLHRACHFFAAADEMNDIHAIVDVLQRSFQHGLKCRNIEGQMPIHLAIRSHNATPH